VNQSYDKTTQKLKTEIIDSGVGITEQKKRTLFKVLRQKVIDKAQGKANAISGIGIGLTNSKIIAEAMNGEISVESELGEFTKVTFTFNAPFLNEFASSARRLTIEKPKKKIPAKRNSFASRDK